MGAWEVSKKLVAHLQQCGVKPADHTHIAMALSKLLSKQISPIAKSMSPARLSAPSVLDEEVLRLQNVQVRQQRRE